LSPSQLQDRRRNLSRFYQVARLAGLDSARRVDDEGNIPIAGVVAAVSGDLPGGRVYRADPRDPEDVRESTSGKVCVDAMNEWPGPVGTTA